MNGTGCSLSFNWTGNEMANTSVCDKKDYVYETPDTVVAVALFFACIWIIMTNSVVVMCFVGSRELQKNLWNLQILSLSFSDVLVGFSSLVVALGYCKPKMLKSYNACSIMFIFYVTSQFASFLHTFCICLHRFITVFFRYKSPRLYQGISKRGILIQVFIVWLVSLLFCMIPFIAFGRWGSSLKSCHLNSLFLDQYNLSISVWNISLLAPQIVVNIMYLSIYFKLRCTWTKLTTILPMNTHDVSTRGNVKNKGLHLTTITKTANMNERPKPSNLKVHPGQSPCNKFAQLKDIHWRNDEDLEVQSLENRIEYTEARLQENCTGPSTSRRIVEGESVTKVDLIKNPNCAIQMNTKHQSSNTRTDSSNCNTGQNKLNHSRHSKVLVTVGLILITVNICITPMNLLFIIETLNEGFLSRKTKLTVLVFSLLNSAVNPIIYAFRMKQLRQSLINGWAVIKILYRT